MRFQRSVGGLALVCGLLGPGAMAQQQPQISEESRTRKPAWQWTIEERLAARFDPEGLKARATAENARLRKEAEMGLPVAEIHLVDPTHVSINGQDNPELFLPGELFNSLLMSAFPPDGRHLKTAREFIEQRAAPLGFGADLWRRLGKVASPYLELRRERDRLHAEQQRSGGPADPRLTRSLAPEVLCRARADALIAAKAEFGEEAFLRLLYEAVAPPIAIASGPPDPKAAEDLRRVEGGCQ